MNQAETILFGSYRLIAPAGPLLCGHDEVALRPKTMEVLCYLAMHAGELVSKETLLRTLWPQLVVNEGGLAICIREIRQALGDDSRTPQYIQTVHRRGYRFIAGLNAPGSNSADSLSGSASATRLTKLVGRELELQQLQHCYAEACSGRRQLLFITGEAGIGKTALVEAWLQTLEQDTNVRVARGECIEQYGAGEAYLPLLEALSGLCSGSDSAAVTAALRSTAPNWLLQLPALLDQSGHELVRTEEIGMNAQRMLREFVNLLTVLSAERTLILVLEDLHWSDPSTVEVLTLLAKQQKTARLLIIGTCRPVELIIHEHPLKTAKRELQLHGQCSELVLDYLAETAVQTYLEQRFTEHASAVFTAPIYRRTAGHPLYMVTLADYLGQHELFSRYIDRSVADTPVTLPDGLDMILPAGLRIAIELQFERLDECERQVLEAASVVGAEFALATLAAWPDIAQEEAEHLCERLGRRGQFITDAGLANWPDGTVSGRYAFRHALYPEVIYNSIGSARRVRLHQMIGERLEQGFGEQSRTVAADLAHHFTQSHDHHRAMRHLQQAANNAQQRYANQESAHYLNRALALLRRLPQTPQRDLEELTLLLQLGPALIAIQGYAAVEVEAVYMRAHTLSEQSGDDRQRFLVLRGLWAYHCVRAEYPRALDVSERFLALAQQIATPEGCLEASRAVGAVLFFSGRFSEAHARLSQGLMTYAPQNHDIQAGPVIHDPSVACSYLYAYTLWFLGYAEQASMQMDMALERARKMAHPYTLICAMGNQLELIQHRREPGLVQAYAKTMLTYADEHGFSYWAAEGAVLNGWALAMLGQAQAGLAQLQQGLATHRDTGAVLSQPYFHGLLAEALARAGELDAGLKAITEGLALAEHTQEGHYEAELHRLQGELLLRQGGMDVADTAESCFQRSLAIAHRQQAKAWELRTATSLARLWCDQDKCQAACDLLAPVYNWFTEGLDMADLRNAKALLDELICNTRQTHYPAE